MNDLKITLSNPNSKVNSYKRIGAVIVGLGIIALTIYIDFLHFKNVKNKYPALSEIIRGSDNFEIINLRTILPITLGFFFILYSVIHKLTAKEEFFQVDKGLLSGRIRKPKHLDITVGPLYWVYPLPPKYSDLNIDLKKLKSIEIGIDEIVLTRFDHEEVILDLSNLDIKNLREVKNYFETLRSSK